MAQPPHNAGSNPIQNVKEMQALENMNKINEEMAGQTPQVSIFTSQLKWNYMARLAEICSKLKMSRPVYEDCLCPLTKLFISVCRIDALSSHAMESSRKNARHLAAKDMMEQIEKLHPFKFHNIDSSYNEDKALIAEVKRKISEKNLSFDSFREYFQIRSRENLQEIFNLLGLSFKTQWYQACPPVVYGIFDFETPRNFTGIGTTKENAEKHLINDIYDVLDTLREDFKKES